jgi:hypothetical protein
LDFVIFKASEKVLEKAQSADAIRMILGNSAEVLADVLTLCVTQRHLSSHSMTNLVLVLGNRLFLLSDPTSMLDEEALRGEYILTF